MIKIPEIQALMEFAKCFHENISSSLLLNVVNYSKNSSLYVQYLVKQNDAETWEVLCLKKLMGELLILFDKDECSQINQTSMQKASNERKYSRMTPCMHWCKQ